MKKITALLALTFVVNTFAGNYKAEFDEAQEIKCHTELKALGCVKGDEENSACSEKKKSKLTKECQKIHEAKKLNL